MGQHADKIVCVCVCGLPVSHSFLVSNEKFKQKKVYFLLLNIPR